MKLRINFLKRERWFELQFQNLFCSNEFLKKLVKFFFNKILWNDISSFFFHARVNSSVSFELNIWLPEKETSCRPFQSDGMYFSFWVWKLIGLKNLRQGGRITQWIAVSLHTQHPRVRFPAFPKFFSEKFFWEKIVDVARLIDSA